MNPPCVTICLPPEHMANTQFGMDIGNIRYIASSIIHDSSTRCDRWSKANLMRRLAKLTPERLCILGLFITTGRKDYRGPVVYFDEGSWMRLTELVDFVGRNKFSPSFMFCIVDDGISCNEMIASFNGLTDAQFASWTSKTHCRVLIALACEFSKWWGLRSLFCNEVGLEYLADKLVVLIDQLNGCLNPSPNIRYVNRMHRQQVAWSDGDIVVDTVDYEKFTLGARPEQYADALKRLADAAYAPRAQHLHPRSCLISTQSLFWFTELPQDLIDFDWLPKTRFAFELFGTAVTGRAPSIQFEGVNDVPKGLARALLGSFVEIPSDTYPIGSKTDANRSEPPAEWVEISIQRFRILRRLVTRADWRLFSTIKLNGDFPDSLPITHCNAFQAFLFTSHVERVLRKHGLIQQSVTVSLPTEEQWEAAARGLEGFEYPWGNCFEDKRCNCDLAYGPEPTPAGLFSPAGDSPFGCQDMAGNVREWTRSYGGVLGIDWRLYEQSPKLRTLDTLRPTDCLIIRGGSYSYDSNCVRTWVRNTQLAERGDQQTGFRLVIEEVKL